MQHLVLTDAIYGTSNNIRRQFPYLRLAGKAFSSADYAHIPIIICIYRKINGSIIGKRQHPNFVPLSGFTCRYTIYLNELVYTYTSTYIRIYTGRIYFPESSLHFLFKVIYRRDTLIQCFFISGSGHCLCLQRDISLF